MAKNARTIAMRDEVFEGLKAMARFNSYRKNSKLTTPSAIIDFLVSDYLNKNADIVKMISDNEAKMMQAALDFNGNST